MATVDGAVQDGEDERLLYDFEASMIMSGPLGREVVTKGVLMFFTCACSQSIRFRGEQQWYDRSDIIGTTCRK